MKNIAIVIDSLSGGGAEKVMLTLGQALASLGHRVALLSLSSHCDYALPKQIDYHHLFGQKISKVDRFWQLKHSVAKLERWFSDYQSSNGKFDLVLSNLDKSNNLLANSNINNVYFVIHNSITEELSRQKKLGIFAYLYLKNSKKNLTNKRLICVSKGIQDEILSSKIITEKSICTIHNPFEFAQIINQSEQLDSNIPATPYIIHVGRLARQKRHDQLFAAFKKVDSNCKLVLLCNKIDKARKLAKKYGIEDRLILPGFQKNPYNWIKQAKVLVLSSDYEGLPTVLIEALAVGTLAVSTRCPHGPDEILTEDFAQFLVPRRDPDALAMALNKALISKLTPSNAQILKQIDAKSIARQYIALCGEQD